MNTSMLEIAVGFILVPYFTWITLAIFNLKQEQAIMKMEMSLMKELKAWFMTQARG